MLSRHQASIKIEGMENLEKRSQQKSAEYTRLVAFITFFLCNVWRCGSCLFVAGKVQLQCEKSLASAVVNLHCLCVGLIEAHISKRHVHLYVVYNICLQTTAVQLKSFSFVFVPVDC